MPAAHVAAAFAGAVHTCPQAPQFFTSESVGMQAPLHLLKPGEHWTSQLLEIQTAAPSAGTGQASSHPPQLAVLVVVSTQALPQAISPAVQDALHWLDEHTSFAPHVP